MKLYTFYQLFKFISIDEIEAIVPVRIGLIQFNKGAKIGRGNIIAGIDLFNYIGDHYECSKRNGIYTIKRIHLHDGHNLYK